MQTILSPVRCANFTLISKHFAVTLLTALVLSTVSACGSDDAAAPQATVPAGGAAADTAESAAPVSGPQLDRSSLVLCDALEPHREELGAIVGFQQRADRSLSVKRNECAVRGPGGAFARVKLQPAMAPSAEAVAKQSYEGEASPVPELGEEAWFVDQPAQPHVIFTMSGLIFDVDAENESTPDRETMIELALRIRAIIRDAN